MSNPPHVAKGVMWRDLEIPFALFRRLIVGLMESTLCPHSLTPCLARRVRAARAEENFGD